MRSGKGAEKGDNGKNGVEIPFINAMAVPVCHGWHDALHSQEKQQYILLI